MMFADNSNSSRTAARELFDVKKNAKPTIKILLYTDAPTEVVRESVGRFGLGRMVQQLEAHAPAFANVSVKWAARYSPDSEHADNKIHVVMANEVQETKEPFDEIWFFGVHQINKDRLDLRLGGGGPESELDADEVDALRKWMDQGGGVLVTGDHNERRPNDAKTEDPNHRCPDKSRNAEFLGLGRALGRCIPRAGLMREWEGSPTSRQEDSNNTQIVTHGSFDNFESQILFQRDRIPQQLILTTFDELGLPSNTGLPHPLFFYKPGRSILLFPDHLHEGEVTVSRGRQDDVWPTKPFKPMPRVVAFGTDKRNGKFIKIIAAYDGDGANVGRIVADSSWHHYFNINLARFDVPAVDDSASDQIGQFYGNLAVWLCPSRKRLQMATVMASSLARDPLILEEIGHPPTNDQTKRRKAGILAHRVLSALASPCEIHELLNMTVPEPHRYFTSSQSIFLPETLPENSLLPSKELFLANLVNRYPRELIEQSELNHSDATLKIVKKAFAQGWEDAGADQARQFERAVELRNKVTAEVARKVSQLQ